MRPHLPIFFRVLILGSLLLSGCKGTAPGKDEPQPPLGTPERIVAIGDLHGDLAAARAALRLGGAIDGNDRWIGGELVVIQTGDILDRGDDEEEIFKLFQRLREEAEAVGGAVHNLNGNHELMNAYLDFRYVTEGGFDDFEEASHFDEVDSLLSSLAPQQRGRATAFRPGGPVAGLLAQWETALIVGSSLFAHGGILPEHVDLGLEAMNGEIRTWLLGEGPQPEWIRGDRSPVWNRLYSDAPDLAACDTLSSVLDRLGVERMVVGHTVQRTGITSFCGGRVWCIDVGMAAHYEGRPEVLEIRGNVVRGLRQRN